MQPTSDTRLWAQAQRTVNVEVTAVRAALLRVLRELDFEVESEQFSSVRAGRGSQLGGATLSPARVPVSLVFGFEVLDSNTAVTVRIEDRWRSPVGRQNAASTAYQRAFDQVLGAVDAALARLDPAAGDGFAPRIQAPALGSSSAAVVDRFGRFESTFKRKTARLLDGKAAPGPGGLGRGNAAAFDLGNAQVAIASPTKVARLDLATVYVMLTAGQLIAARPGKLPPPMVAQVRELVIMLEQRVDTSAPPQPFLQQLEVSEAQAPVVSFLHQQTRLRDQLPLRTLQVCDTCRLEKVINPDFVQMRERSRRMKVLTGSFGAVIGAHHISPYVLVGKLVQLKNSDPDFVCQRCQGLEADETIITFCPRCGDRRSEAVLRECERCKLDFRTLLTPQVIWQDIAELGSWTPAAIGGVAGDVGGWTAPPADGGQWTAPSAEPGQWTAPPAAGGAGQWAAPAADGGQWTAPPAEPGQWTAPPADGGQWTAPPVASSPAVTAGWYADYSGRHEYRYWDGQAWTTSVSDAGVVSSDAV